MEGEKSLELPLICPNEEHNWGIDPSMHGCGHSSGDHAVGELIVMFTPTDKGQPGAICQKCFLEFGTNKRNENFCWAYLSLSSW